jgi:hypothetical protein
VASEIFAKKEGMNLTRLDACLKEARDSLLNVRKKRIHPFKDDKIITSWNGLMIAAFAKGYQAFGDQVYADAARSAADFILKTLRTADGRLLRRYRQGDADYTGYLDDYAFLIWGLIELYEATFELSCLEQAVALNKSMIGIFWDEQGGGLYFTGKGNESLITRSKEIYDGALPSGNSVAALNFLRLGRLTGNVDLGQRAEQLIRAFPDRLRNTRWPILSYWSPLILWWDRVRRSLLLETLPLRSPRLWSGPFTESFCPTQWCYYTLMAPRVKGLKPYRPLLKECVP